MDMSTVNTVITIGWDSLLKLMGSLVISLGGGAAIALFVFHFAADRLAERLKAKYQLELDKRKIKLMKTASPSLYLRRMSLEKMLRLFKKTSTRDTWR